MPAVVRKPGSLLGHTHTVGKCKLAARHHHDFSVSAPVQAAQLRPMQGMEFAKTVDLVSNAIEVRSAWIASSIEGNISSPLRERLWRLPSTHGAPNSQPHS